MDITIQGPRKGGLRIGLRDGGHVILTCSACDKHLVDIHITQPGKRDRNGKPFSWRGKATCCYCGDHSFVKTWEGLYHLGGWGIPNPANPDDPDDNLVLTCVDTTTEEKDQEGKPLLVFHTKKGEDEK